MWFLYKSDLSIYFTETIDKFSEIKKSDVIFHIINQIKVSRVYWAYHSITGGSFINYTLKSTRGVSRVPSDNRERIITTSDVSIPVIEIFIISDISIPAIGIFIISDTSIPEI